MWFLLTLTILGDLHGIESSAIIRVAQKINAHGDAEQVDDAPNVPQTKKRKRLPQKCVALTACISAYGVGNDSVDAKEDLKATNYKFVKGFSSKKGNDTDFVGLWCNCRQCIMNFRGSDTMEDFATTYNFTPVSAWGIPGVHAGLKYELEALIKVMDFSFIRGACTGKTLTITGHSLGGGLAQLFSLLLNKAGDPLKAGIKADFLYTFGAMSVGTVNLPNDVAQDGCMKGEQFYNGQESSNNMILVDVAKQPSVGGHVLVPIKSLKTVLLGPQQTMQFECGTALPDHVGSFPVVRNQVPNKRGYKDWRVNHLLATYALNMGCISFNRFRKTYNSFMVHLPAEFNRTVGFLKFKMRQKSKMPKNVTNATKLI